MTSTSEKHDHAALAAFRQWLENYREFWRAEFRRTAQPIVEEHARTTIATIDYVLAEFDRRFPQERT